MARSDVYDDNVKNVLVGSWVTYKGDKARVISKTKYEGAKYNKYWVVGLRFEDTSIKSRTVSIGSVRLLNRRLQKLWLKHNKGYPFTVNLLNFKRGLLIVAREKESSSDFLQFMDGFLGDVDKETLKRRYRKDYKVFKKRLHMLAEFAKLAFDYFDIDSPLYCFEDNYITRALAKKGVRTVKDLLSVRRPELYTGYLSNHVDALNDFICSVLLYKSTPMHSWGELINL